MREVGGFFLSGCTSLTGVNLASLHAIEAIPSFFLHSCSGLKEVDLSPLTHVREVGSNFLDGCANLTHFALPPQLSAESLPPMHGGFMKAIA